MGYGRRLLPLLSILALAGPALAADSLLGHTLSVTKFSGNPPSGRSYKLTIKASRDGNPASFPMPANPLLNGAYVSIERDGGFLFDDLTFGSWTGLGNPAGSGGWKYRNPAAPFGGEVKTLTITPRSIRIMTRGAGTMPPPTLPVGAIDTTIVAAAERYCARAEPPHSAVKEGSSVKTKSQPPPVACRPCTPGLDDDEDRLNNCQETDTGVFVSTEDTGTDPADADTDGDGIDDGDESIGTTAGLDLPALGTNPLRRDLLVEYDWFTDSLECGAHSHRPTTGALDRVTTAFANAPVPNPDGSTGINFIHDRGQGGVFTGGNLIVDANGVLGGGVNAAEFKNYKVANFAANRHGYFHYTILPHRYNNDSGSSGQAELPGDDMIVSLYCAGSDGNVANTIMHELGHNLRLGHGGGGNCNYKPNYNSVMNYLYQFPGVDNDCDPPGDGVLDYSVGDRIPLDENDLDEFMGTCGAPAWDWDEDSVIETGVVFDINADDALQPATCAGNLTVLRDHDDWANLSLTAGLFDADGAPRAVSPVIDCDNPAPLP